LITCIKKKILVRRHVTAMVHPGGTNTQQGLIAVWCTDTSPTEKFLAFSQIELKAELKSGNIKLFIKMDNL